ncbi:Probable valine--tRNA ligase, partial [Durusdinium trenchii]
SFEPHKVEAGVYDWWQEGGAFEVDKQQGKSGKVFSMVIPPPNVTGQLHIGHALTVTIQDALVRKHKMQGDQVVWIPGVDHAGIATQTVVEKKLMKTTGETRHDLGRERFLDKVWEWYEEYNHRIDNQLKRLGSSLDWSRKVFTMDAPRREAVTQAFVSMHERGLIYRDVRMINWCPHLRTVISDLEVEFEEISSPRKLKLPGKSNPVEFGVMHTFGYPVEGSSEVLQVSTTRLETMLGDVAVMVHPEDARYQHLHGKKVVHPFFPERKLPILVDEVLVDMEQGTGAVKITPAHDPNDLEAARRQPKELGLELTTIMNEDGTMNDTCGPEWAGRDRFEVRDALVQALDFKGLYFGKKPNAMSLARCSRSGDVVEPLLMPQWFVKCDEMASRALDVVADGKLEMAPDYHRKTWNHFLGNIHDWCVSRQLWWGHRVPAYRVIFSDAAVAEEEEHWVVAKSVEEAHTQVYNKYGLERDSGAYRLEQDPDVLDTWFSSSLFPMTALNWPQEEEQQQGQEGQSLLQRAYPLSLMETGTDILFFWVARMVMMCTTLHPKGEIPFKKVYLHPIIRDRQGRKMSKSLGNVIDPVHVIDGASLDTLIGELHKGNLGQEEIAFATSALKKDFAEGIPRCGTDALRLALASYLHTGVAINMDVARVVQWRQFLNKIWNAQQFLLHYQRQDEVSQQAEVATPQQLETRWILSRLSHCVAACNKSYDEIDLGKVTASISDFVVGELCDVYIEASKRNLRDDASAKSYVEAMRTLVDCLDQTFRLMHPLAPFATEELWHRLLGSQGQHPSSWLGSACSDRAQYSPSSMLAESEFPKTESWAHFRDLDAERDMGLVMEAVRAARTLRENLIGVIESTRLYEQVEFVVDDLTLAEAQTLSSQTALIEQLARMKRVDVITGAGPATPGSVQLDLAVRPGILARLTIQIRAGDRSKVEREMQLNTKRQGKLTKSIAQWEARLDNPKYIAKTPEHAQQKGRDTLTKLRADLSSLEASAETFSKLIASKSE